MRKNPNTNKSSFFPILQRFLNLCLHILLVLALFMLLRIIFYRYNINYFSNISNARLLTLAKGGLLFDISAIMYLNVLYISLFLLPFPFVQKKIWRVFMFYLFIVVNAAALIANTGDIFYFDFTLKRTTADVFMYAGENNIGQVFADFIVDYWYAFLIGIFAIFLLVFLYKKLRFKEAPIQLNFVSLLIGFLFWGGSIALSIIGMRGSIVEKTFPLTVGDAARYAEKPAEMALILNTPFSILKTLERESLDEKSYFPQTSLDTLYKPVYKPSNQGRFKPDNVIILVMESFSEKFVGYFNPKVTPAESYTPFLDSLAANSYCFMRAFANGRQSISALPAICAGIPYVQQPYVISSYVFNKINGLGQLLKEKNYNTSFFHGANNGSLGLGGFMKSAGYDSYFGKDEYNNDDDYDGSWGIRDEAFFSFFADKIKDFPQPFHSLIFSLSSHNPYSLPKQYADSFPNLKDPKARAYRYSDNALRTFFGKVKEYDWYKNTLFVITADHATRSSKGGYAGTIEDYAVPIIFFHPGDSTLKGKDSTVMQHLDIMPSIAHYLNYDKAFFSFGANVFDKENKGEAFINMDNIWQYISDDYVALFKQDEVFALYNYKKDTQLADNLKEKLPEKTIQYQNKLRAFIQTHNKAMINNALTLKK